MLRSTGCMPSCSDSSSRSSTSSFSVQSNAPWAILVTPWTPIVLSRGQIVLSVSSQLTSFFIQTFIFELLFQLMRSLTTLMACNWLRRVVCFAESVIWFNFRECPYPLTKIKLQLLITLSSRFLGSMSAHIFVNYY